MAAIKLYTDSGKTYSTDDSMEIHRGGEGRIMALKNEPGLVAKLYHAGKIPVQAERISALSKLDSALFVAPGEIVKNKKGEILGFTMPYLGKDYFPLSNLFSKNYCILNNIDNNFKTLIAEKLIQALQAAHIHKITIGDLNQYNVLITLSGDLKMIDTDSYATENYPHSEILLDDIRDYLYGGHVSFESDFFALSVLVFYNYTFSHPFKGIHKKYATLAERMIHKIPVFAKDSDLIPPRVYVPITENFLQDQFEKIFARGERFLLSIKGAVPAAATQIVRKPIVTPTAGVEIIPVLENFDFIDFRFNETMGILETRDNFIVVDASARGKILQKAVFSKLEVRAVYLSDSQIFIRRNDALFLYQSPASVLELANFKFPQDAFVQAFENIVCVLSKDVLYQLYLNEIFNNSIKITRSEVFEQSFTTHSGLFQNTGGVYRIFYNTGKDLASVSLPKPIKKVLQSSFVGMMQYIENKNIFNKYFRIKGLDVEIDNENREAVYDFALIPTAKYTGFIAEPHEKKIVLKRTEDFSVSGEIDCPVVSSASKLGYCRAGLTVFEEQKVFLLNTKK